MYKKHRKCVAEWFTVNLKIKSLRKLVASFRTNFLQSRIKRQNLLNKPELCILIFKQDTDNYLIN